MKRILRLLKKWMLTVFAVISFFSTFNSVLKSKTLIMILQDHRDKMCFHDNVCKTFQTPRPFIYLFPSDLWENTWHLASIHPYHPKHQKSCVCLCVCSAIEWAKWLSNCVRVWDNSVGFSLHNWLFFWLSGLACSQCTPHMCTHNTLLVSLSLLYKAPFHLLTLSVLSLMLSFCLFSCLLQSLGLKHT